MFRVVVGGEALSVVAPSGSVICSQILELFAVTVRNCDC
jgi:hypothetical protein